MKKKELKLKLKELQKESELTSEKYLESMSVDFEIISKILEKYGDVRVENYLDYDFIYSNEGVLHKPKERTIRFTLNTLL